MKSSPLCRSNFPISSISLGTWLSAGDVLPVKVFADVVAAAFDAGITTIDTADSYAFGGAEVALGEVLRSYPRDRFVLLTKCFFSTDPKQQEPFGISKEAVMRAAEASLQRLGVEMIDVLQCHRFDPKVPVAETTQAMERLVRDGKIRYWGVSKWPNAAIREAMDAGGEHLVCRQELYNLFHRQPEREHFEFCREAGISFLAYSPLARGMLTGKYLEGIPQGSRAAHEQNKQTVYDLTPEKLKQVERLKVLADEKGCTTGQLALAFLLLQNPVSSVIIGASSARQVLDNARAAEVILTTEDVALINSIFATTALPEDKVKAHGRAN